MRVADWTQVFHGRSRGAALCAVALVCASLFASAVSALHRSPSMIAEGDSDGSGGRVRLSETRYHVRDPDRVLRRNVFESTLRASASRSAGPPSTRQAMTVCPGDARVTGAAIATDPAWSFAFVAARAHDPAMPVREGQALDEGQVLALGWAPQLGGYVVIRRRTEVCYLAQYMVRPRAEGTRGATVTAGAMGAPQGALAEEFSRGLERVAPGQFTVRRALVNRLLENPADLAQYRASPLMTDGQVVGWSLAGVRPDSSLARLGFQSGDVIRRVNGIAITSPDVALAAYMQLQRADHISIGITRGGAAMTVDYDVRR